MENAEKKRVRGKTRDENLKSVGWKIGGRASSERRGRCLMEIDS